MHILPRDRRADVAIVLSAQTEYIEGSGVIAENGALPQKDSDAQISWRCSVAEILSFVRPGTSGGAIKSRTISSLLPPLKRDHRILTKLTITFQKVLYFTAASLLQRHEVYRAKFAAEVCRKHWPDIVRS